MKYYPLIYINQEKEMKSLKVSLFSFHINYLCLTNNISIRYVKTEEQCVCDRDYNLVKGKWVQTNNTVNILPITNDVSYAIALHEIGHVLGPLQKSNRLDQEAGAWQWAMEHSKAWTKAMQACMVRCMTTYNDATVFSPSTAFSALYNSAKEKENG